MVLATRCCKPDRLSWTPTPCKAGRRDLTPQSCSLVFTCVPWLCPSRQTILFKLKTFHFPLSPTCSFHPTVLAVQPSSPAEPINAHASLVGCSVTLHTSVQLPTSSHIWPRSGLQLQRNTACCAYTHTCMHAHTHTRAREHTRTLAIPLRLHTAQLRSKTPTAPSL